MKPNFPATNWHNNLILSEISVIDWWRNACIDQLFFFFFFWKKVSFPVHFPNEETRSGNNCSWIQVGCVRGNQTDRVDGELNSCLMWPRKSVLEKYYYCLSKNWSRELQFQLIFRKIQGEVSRAAHKTCTHVSCCNFDNTVNTFLTFE